MRDFYCQCGNTLFFQNNNCLQCSRTVGFVPRATMMTALEPLGGGRWQVPTSGHVEGRIYRLCENSAVYDACNWLVPEDDSNPLCASCRLTRTIPDLHVPRHLELWRRLELAKRHLLFNIGQLGLTVEGRADDPVNGLAFDFLADSTAATEFTQPIIGQAPISTGHASGLITINIAEADDVARARMREQMGEHYRTLLGHFRHEVGHYFWMRLIEGSPHITGFRDLFGDERDNYNDALQRHYANGAPAHWIDRFVTPYASAHPWEDWAESWAHYLHMRDTLETAIEYELVRQPPWRRDAIDFDALMFEWTQLTIAVNAVNRSMGHPDAYPFVLNAAVRLKLGFIHQVVVAADNAADPT